MSINKEKLENALKILNDRINTNSKHIKNNLSHLQTLTDKMAELAKITSEMHDGMIKILKVINNAKIIKDVSNEKSKRK